MLRKTLLGIALTAVAWLVIFSCREAGTVRTETLRAACVGDSITRGTGVEQRRRNSYPARLAALLGRDWEVRNFGENNTTVFRKGEIAYDRTAALQEALLYRPHVVIIAFGANDARPWNWKHRKDLVGDYLTLLGRFQALPEKPRIWLCTPPPAFRGKGGAPDPVIQNEIIPLIRQVARQAGVPVIDLNRALSGKKELFPDGVHPNKEGAQLIAENVFTALQEEQQRR